MTEKMLKEKYSKVLEGKSWKLMSPLSMKDNDIVTVSGIEEVDKDLLVYYYNDNKVITLDLNQIVLGWEGTLKENIKSCLKTKSHKELFFPSGLINSTMLTYISKGSRGQVLLDLGHLGDFVFPDGSSAPREIEVIMADSRKVVTVDDYKEIPTIKKSSDIISEHITKIRQSRFSKAAIPMIFSGKHLNGREIDIMINQIRESDNVVTEDSILKLVSLLVEEIWIS